MWGYDGFCCGFVWWWIIPIAMIALCFFMMRRRMTCRSSFDTGDQIWRSRPESARDILDKRYARGEIGKEEYEEKKRDLGLTTG